MKKFVFYLMTLFMGALIWVSCKQQQEERQKKRDLAKIDTLCATYVESSMNNDLDLFMTLWDENASRSEPGLHAVHGKENIRAHFESVMNQADVEWSGVAWNTEWWGEVAVTTGIATALIKPRDGGPESQFDIEILDIMKKQEDGSWKIYRDLVNFKPSPGAEAVADSAFLESNPYY